MYNLFFIDCSNSDKTNQEDINNVETIEEHDIGKCLIDLLEIGSNPEFLDLENNRNRMIHNRCHEIMYNLSQINRIPGDILFVITSSSEKRCYSNKVIENIRHERKDDPIIKLSNDDECKYTPKTGVLHIPMGYIGNRKYYEKLSELIDFTLYPPKIYISYGNRNESGIDEYIKNIKVCFKKTFNNISIFHDKSDIEHGDYIDEFMEGLKDSDYLISLMNNRYFESPDCMDEFYGFYKKFKNIEIFKKRFLSIIMSNAEDKFDGMGATTNFWKNELLNIANSINNEFDKTKIRDARIAVQTLENVISIFEDHIIPRRNEGDEAMLNEFFATIISKINQDISERGGFLTYYTKKSEIRKVLNGDISEIMIHLDDPLF